MPIVDDLQEVAPLLGGERGEAPVVEDQQLDARQALEEPCMAAVTACQRQRIEQPWHAMIEDGAIVAAGLVAERAGNPTFADAGRADDEQVLVPSIQSPATSLANSALSSPRGAFMSTSSTTAFWRRLANFKRLTSRLFSRSIASRSTIRASRSSKRERGDVGLSSLLLERLRHAGEPERDQAVVGGMGEHLLFLPFHRRVASAALRQW